MGDEKSWRAELDRWLEPFVAELNHAARRTMCPHPIAGLLGLALTAMLAYALLQHRRLARAGRGKS